nr:immunoglobulin heavy chain junction region [Macaca mulatta]
CIRGAPRLLRYFEFW